MKTARRSSTRRATPATRSPPASGSGYTPQGWDTVLRMMSNHGVALRPDQLPLARAYLVNTFPVKPRPSAVIIPGPVKVSMKAWRVATPGSRPHDPLAARDGSPREGHFVLANSLVNQVTLVRIGK